MRNPAIYGLALVLAVLAVAWGVESCHRGAGTEAEHQAAVHEGEANAHVSQAQALPDHTQALAQAQADVDRARAEVARLRKLLAAKPSIPVPDPVGPGSANDAPIPADHRDEVIAAQTILIAAQDGQIKGLKLALEDEKSRSGQWQAAFEAERKRALAQEAATEAWKKAVKGSRWTGRIEGFAAGIALGYVGGRR